MIRCSGGPQSTVIEAFDKGIQSILIGEATPEEVAARVAAVKQRETQRQAQRRTSHVVH